MRPSASIPTASIKVFEDREQLTVEIAPKRSWKPLAREMLLTILLVLLAIQFAPHISMRATWPNTAVAAGFLIFLAVLVCKSVLRWIWYAFGQEEIVLRAGVLTVVRRIGYLAWSRVYLVQRLRDLHTVFQPSALWAWHIYRVIRGSLGFNYDGSACHFADRLTDDQAKELLKKFRHWLPERTWTPILGLNK